MKHFLLLILAVSLTPKLLAEELVGSFTINYVDCRFIYANLTIPGPLSCESTEGLETRCIKNGKDVMCDYVHEKTGKIKNQPSHYIVDSEDDNYIYMGTETNAARIHINKKTWGVIMTTYVFYGTMPDIFAIKFCSGKVKFK